MRNLNEHLQNDFFNFQITLRKVLTFFFYIMWEVIKGRDVLTLIPKTRKNVFSQSFCRPCENWLVPQLWWYSIDKWNFFHLILLIVDVKLIIYQWILSFSVFLSWVKSPWYSIVGGGECHKRKKNEIKSRAEKAENKRILVFKKRNKKETI